MIADSLSLKVLLSLTFLALRPPLQESWLAWMSDSVLAKPPQSLAEIITQDVP